MNTKLPRLMYQNFENNVQLCFFSSIYLHTLKSSLGLMKTVESMKKSLSKFYFYNCFAQQDFKPLLE